MVERRVVERRVVGRHAWVAVLLGGLVLNVAVLVTVVATENPNLVPALILLGSAFVPATFLAFAAGRTPRWEVTGGLLGFIALVGGVVGIVFAGWFEYDEMRALPWLGVAGVGLIEEAAKLVVPVAVLLVAWRRRGGAADGLMIGMACGLGFAVLETMGYAFVTLIQSRGSIGAVERILLVRGLLSPAGHTAWAGLTCAALWAFVVRPALRTALAFGGTFAGVVILHAAWDGFNTPVAYAVLGVISVGWLLWRIRGIRLTGEPAGAPAPVSAVPLAAGG
ncbi:PrsW family intramembrane metalloprotease [Dactylosporangium aurantiacum]|uniref:PrsW family intramembrane metalloprotease n=1 Tax=Dactylosporangium aurantiacum TaxID=35754 RepID=A0A9Q9MLL6_9ACTN|nr:PrsW family glutamic-type intramembrane protease [Dactylosporangium aurantiacum]MDG6105625.1 PrsW family glutamic-type intramembrane protease [Dactylosporangium aurantiacum]UWZ57041.1 PrsW family intramembrane metalloprotease [Dactylosporangium aurantiacum]